MHRRFIYAVTIVGTAALLVFFFWPQLHKSQRPLQREDGTVAYERAREYWVEYIHRRGTSAAQTAFVIEAKNLSPFGAHVLAHAFGEALYRTLATQGFAFCEDVFMYGCTHQFIGTAIADKGVAIVHQFADECAKKEPAAAYGCRHGIGHGTVGFFGYTLESLEESLEMCRAIDERSDTEACTEGSFMEFQLKELLAEETGQLFSPRPYSEDARHYPCNSVAQEYRGACYFIQPRWWLAVLGENRPTDTVYAQIGTYCAEIPELEIRKKCFEGLGYEIPLLDTHDTALSSTLCVAASEDTVDRRHCEDSAYAASRAKR